MNGPERNWYGLLSWMTVYAIAMALLESAVVVYLRAMYYPGGFSFPLGPIDPGIATTESCREVATLVMLFAPGAMVSRSGLQRFAWFAYCFGIWDIFYYVFLKLLLDWPASLLEWDLLFLVPTPWVGPVWVPLLISVGLVLLALIILHGANAAERIDPDLIAWVLLLSSAFLFLASFMVEPIRWLSAAGEPLFGTAAVNAFLNGFVPAWYPWPLTLAGVVFGAAGLLRLSVRAIGR